MISSPTPERERALLELAERCEAASGPDRELDTAVCRTTAAAVEQPDGTWIWCFSGGSTHSVDPRPFTASLDAALALCAEKLPDTPDRLHHGCVWFGSGGGILLTPSARISYQQRDANAEGGWALGMLNQHPVQAATPALALCAALLRALSSTPEGETGRG